EHFDRGLLSGHEDHRWKSQSARQLRSVLRRLSQAVHRRRQLQQGHERRPATRRSEVFQRKEPDGSDVDSGTGGGEMIRRALLSLCLCVLVVTTNLHGAENVSVKLPAYTKTQLPNGLTLLLMEQHEVPIVSFNLILKTGSVADPI